MHRLCGCLNCHFQPSIRILSGMYNMYQIMFHFNLEPGPDVVIFFMLSFAEHDILNAHKYKAVTKFNIFQAQISLACYFSCS